jgi:preprotein translocase subunit SecE
VARDRKRAKQRRERGAAAVGRAKGAQASSPVRADVPGALDHASADVDEFDAALINGAGGLTAPPDADVQEAPEVDVRQAPDDALLSRDELQVPVVGGSGSGGSGNGLTHGGSGGGGGHGGEPERSSGAPLRGGNRAVGFVRASWAELQRVQWPDRRQVFQATAVVIGFVAIAGAYLGLADYVAKEIVELIL